jgi:polar amino acid transport system substrate-binding protein
MNSNDDRQKKWILIILGLAILIGIAIVAIFIFSFFIIEKAEATQTATPSLSPTATLIPTSTFLPTSTPTPTPQASDPVWDRIQAAGKIVVGISADYPPFAYVDQDFEITGFDIALIEEIGKRLNLPLDIRNMAFDGLGNALQVDQIDLAIAAISISPERDTFIDFSNVYYVGEDALLANQDSLISINRIEDLAAYRVGVQKSSVYETWLDTTLVEPGLMPPQYLMTFETPEEAVQSLSSPNSLVDLVVMDFLPAEVAERKFPVKIIKHGLYPQSFAIGLPSGAFTLQANLNDLLLQIQNDDTMAALYKQYLDIDKLLPIPTPFPTPAPATPSACVDSLALVQDLNYPDYNMTAPPQFDPGATFKKGWRILNTGNCTWDSTYAMSYVGSNPPNEPVGGNPVAIQGIVPPGQTYDMYVTITAPWQPGIYQSFWTLRAPSGLYFGERLWAGFEVSGLKPPTPPPQTPVIYSFTVNTNQILEDGCVNLDWQFDGQDLALTRLFRGDQVLLQDIPYSGGTTDCPPGTGQMEYRLVIDSEFAGSAHASQFVDVTPHTDPTPTPNPTPEHPPVIEHFSVDNHEIHLGQCVDLSWSFRGSSLALTQLLRNNEVISSDLAPSGSQQDCPPDPGHIEYRLEVDSEFSGAAHQSRFVNVLNPAPSEGSASVITSFTAGFDQVDIGVSVNLSWSFTGTSLASAVLTRNGALIQSDIPLEGNFEDCITDPDLICKIIYELACGKL